ncbi:dachshund homolog 1-like isoform X4 [Asterias rubens]|uniref:dachshund homolog 1-like isoform X4 n=1 Tax=Asterias rubens TaxID=7604 RepID=UPI0014550913|nr:dachshund homolog 1-like isoform X4 [Asterias rubens]
MLHGLGHGADPLKKPKIENGVGLANLKAHLPFNGYESLMAGNSPYLLTTHPALVASSSFAAHHISSPSIYTNGNFIGSASSIQNSLGSPNSKSSSGSGDHPGTDNEDSISPRTDHSCGGGGGMGSPHGDSEFNANARDDIPTSSPSVHSHANNHSKSSAHINGLLAVDISSSRTSSSHCPSVSPERERPIHSTVHSHPLTNSTSLSLDHAAAAREIMSHHGPSSIETLLTNIQGLLKVAADNARQQEKHIHLERAELRLELLRERELREALEKQLIAEQKRLAIILKRLKKEKKGRRRLQEQIEMSHGKRLGMPGETEAAVIARQNSTESLRALNGECESLSHELEKERLARSEVDKKSPGSDGSPVSFSPPPQAAVPFQHDQAYYRWQEMEDGRIKRVDY